MADYSPIVIFIYNRPLHTKKMIDSLIANEEFSKSPVFIYADGPKNIGEEKNIKKTRDVIFSLKAENINLIKSSKNKGLATSVIEGVTAVCAKYGKVIVIEDDLILSRYFLKYMNDALRKYQDKSNVMSISGYNYPVREKLPETFFFRTASSWGWATWQRAWSKFEPDPRKLISDIEKNKGLVTKFNIDNSVDYLGMLKAQAKDKIDSWGIRWDASLLLNDGLCLYPGKSLVRNIGHDGSGIHSGIDDRFDTDIYDGPISFFCDDVMENPEALEAIKKFYKETKKSLFKRLKDKLIRKLRAKK
jgi:hypothetical protein